MQRRRPRTSLPLRLRLLLPLPLAQCPRSLLRSFSCFKCRLVVWDATAAQGEEDGGGKKIMKTATLIMKVFRAASSCAELTPRSWLVSFEIIICAMVRRCVLVINIAVLPHVVNFVSHSSSSLASLRLFKDLRSSFCFSSGIPWLDSSSVKSRCRVWGGEQGAGCAVFCLNSIQFLASSRCMRRL